MTATARSTLNEALVKLTDLRAGERALVARIERIEQYRASAPARMDAAAMCLIEAGGYVAETNEDLTPLKEELGVELSLEVVYGADFTIKSGGPPNWLAKPHLVSSGQVFAAGMSLGSPFGAPLSTHSTMVAISASVSERSFLNC